MAAMELVTLCFLKYLQFQEAFHSTFSHIHYVQIIYADLKQDTCLDSYLKGMGGLTLSLSLETKILTSKSTSFNNFIIFYADRKDEQRLKSLISSDLDQFPSYSNVLIVHSTNIQRKESEEIIDNAFNNSILNVTILCLALSIKKAHANIISNQETDWFNVNKTKALRITLFHYEPLVYYNKKDGLYDGIEKNIIDAIIQDRNVTYLEHEPNSWHYLLDDVGNGTADIGLCGTWLDSINYSKIEPTLYYLESCNTFLVPKSKLIALRPSYILQALSITSYSVLLLTIILISIITNILQPVNQRNWIEQFFSVFGVVINVAVSRIPQRNSFRYIFAVWFLSSILFNIFFAAGLTKRLSFPQFSPPVNTFEDMHIQHIMWLQRSFNIIPVINLSQNYYQRNLMSLVADVRNGTHDEREVDFSRFAFPVNIFKTNLDISGEISETTGKYAKPLNECLSKAYFIQLLRKNSPLKSRFDKKFTQITEAGLIDAWMNYNMYKSYNEVVNLKRLFQVYPHYDAVIALTIGHFQGAYIILAVGYLFASSLFIVELFY